MKKYEISELGALVIIGVSLLTSLGASFVSHHSPIAGLVGLSAAIFIGVFGAICLKKIEVSKR